MKSRLFLPFCLFFVLSLLFLPSFVHTSVISASSSTRRPLCHDNENVALLQFKQSFIIDKSASRDPSAYPKTESWRLQGGHVDCCTWDGIECDNSTGHVINIDLSSSFLYGSINSRCSLFYLTHLRGLNLADNHFNHSQIPPSLGYLSELSYLNLSYSAFSGPVPSDISKLSNLVSLDLSSNGPMMSPDMSETYLLVLKTSDFRSLLQNLTKLEVLHLPNVYIPSTVPSFMANLSSLASLLLTGCNLNGEFPPSVFQLPNLRYIDVSGNGGLRGHLPEFNSSSPLVRLDLGETSFTGELPESLGNLPSLQFFDTLQSGFFGKIPSSFGNLTQLVYLGLWGNPFEVPNLSPLSWLGRLTKLTLLGLHGVNLNSEIPPSIANLTQLQGLFLQNSQMTGQIPSWLPKLNQLSTLDLTFNELEGLIPYSISKLSQLTRLDVSFNNLQGSIPVSIFQLRNLRRLGLAGNNFSGTVELNSVLMLQNLSQLYLSENKLTLDVSIDTSGANLPKFAHLGLGSCNLGQFPDFLRAQDQLQWLDLRDNNIHGLIPGWIWSISKDTLGRMVLSGNFLTGFEPYPDIIGTLIQLNVLDLSANMLQGSLPIAPPTITEYIVPYNKFSGNIPPFFCSVKSLNILDLSHNNLSGTIPPCLGNLSASLELLDLGDNNFQGSIPPMHLDDCNLRVLTLGRNQLEGLVPKSLANCAGLEFLDLGNNQISDTFPTWLAALQELKVLILRSNRFYGELGNQEANFDQFPLLRIIDLSRNNLSGELPTQYILNWKAMKVAKAHKLIYMEIMFSTQAYGVKRDLVLYSSFKYSMLITNKGIDLQYSKILEFFVAMDFSGNKFRGEIPESIGNLEGLHMLNLSNNVLDGSIPSSLGNLTELESLDLSRNKLSGEIPQQLTQLNFLAVFNVSENNLTGPIPRGKQFDTFPHSSYEGNSGLNEGDSGLCGNPLSRKCGNSEALPPPTTSSFDENGDKGGSAFQFGWKPVVIGYAGGLLVGLAIGHVVVTMRREWFLKTFRIRPRTRMSSRRR